jgi:hypothetical protein
MRTGRAGTRAVSRANVVTVYTTLSVRMPGESLPKYRSVTVERSSTSTSPKTPGPAVASGNTTDVLNRCVAVRETANRSPICTLSAEA